MIPEPFDIDRPTLHYPINDTDPHTNGGANLDPWVYQGPSPKEFAYHNDFDPLCGLILTRNGNDTRNNYFDLSHLQTRFSNEIADKIPTSTMIFINEMYARLPVPMNTKPNVFRGGFRTAAEFRRSAGGARQAAADETWVALPKIRKGKSTDVEAYSRESFAMKPTPKVNWALSSVNDWFVFFCALKFYNMLVSELNSVGIQHQSGTLNLGSYNTLAVPYHNITHAWNGCHLKGEDLPRERRNMMVQLNSSFFYTATEKVKTAARNQLRSITIDIPDYTDALPGIDRLTAFQPKRMIHKWVEKCRTQEDAAMAIMLADGAVLEWR